MDIALKNLLCEWNLSHLYDHFIDNHITINILKILTPRHIDTLFRHMPVGELALFEIRLKEWKETDNISAKSPKLLSLNNDSCGNTPAFVKEPICSVSEILSSSQNGKLLLAYYMEHKEFKEEQRNLLVETITKYVEARGHNCTFAEYTEIGKQIGKIFPTESVEYYASGKKGKLYYKICSLKRVPKGLLGQKALSTPEATDVIYHPETDSEEALKSLRSKYTTANEKDLFWRKCSQLRFSQISQSKSINDVLTLWPEYTKPSGLQLIEIDFSIKYPKANDFVPTWRIYEAKVLNLMKSKITPSSVLKKLNELDSLDEESKTFAIFWNLHNLFPPHIKVIEEDGCKRRKKYSVTDSQTSFAIVARSNEEMDLKLNLRKIQSKCVQPTLLIVGDEFNVKSIYIYFNGNRYPMKKVLIAIDILYKIFFVFNLKFPDESELFYTFLQTMYYEMKADKSFAKVSVIRDEILNLKII